MKRITFIDDHEDNGSINFDKNISCLQR